MKMSVSESRSYTRGLGVSNNRRRMMGLAPMRKSFYAVQKKAAKSKAQLDAVSFCEFFGL